MNIHSAISILATCLLASAARGQGLISWETGLEGWTAGEGASLDTSTIGATDGSQSLAITTPMANMWYATPANFGFAEVDRGAFFTGATEILLDVSYADPGYTDWVSPVTVEVIIQGDGLAWTPLGEREVVVDGPPATFSWPLTVGQAASLAGGSWAQVVLKFTYGNGGATADAAVFHVDNFRTTVEIMQPPESDYFWASEATDARWSDSSWTAEGGTELLTVPADGTAGVAFVASETANFVTELGADQHVESIVFGSGTGWVDILGTHDLTIGSEGIFIESGGGPVDINTTGQVILGADQLWANNDAGSLAVLSVISGDFHLTTGGTGPIVLAGANSHTGGTTIQQGMLILEDELALGAPGSSLAVDGGTVDLNGFDITLGGISGMAGGSIRNGGFDPVTLTFDTQTDQTYGAAINNGPGGLSLVKTGPGSLTLAGAGDYAGDVLIQEGALIANSGVFGVPNATNFGSAQLPERTITIATDASAVLNSNNVLGNNQGDPTLLPTFHIDGGTLDTIRYNLIGNIVLDGGTLSNNSTDAGNYAGYQFKGIIEVEGTQPSFITAGTLAGNHLSTETEFKVADVTGDDDADLIVTAPLVDQSGDFGLAAGGLVKTGPGTLSLEGPINYSGNTRVMEGTLSLLGAGFGDTATVEIAAGATLHLDHLDSDAIGALIVDGQTMAEGVYGGPESGASNTLDELSGDGWLFVLDDPFVAWMATFPALSGGDLEADADPDGDGMTNLEEFAFDGDPTDPAPSQKVRRGLQAIADENVLVITLPVRDDSTASGSAPLQLTALNFSYEIRGSNDLAVYDQPVSEVLPALNGDPEMPALNAGWSYRTFRLDGAIGGESSRGPRGFLDVAIEPQP